MSGSPMVPLNGVQNSMLPSSQMQSMLQ